MDLMTTASEEAIRNWANAKPFVRRVWIFGSRARGDHRPDSDLDVAVEIDPVGNDEDADISWTADSNDWRAELSGVPLQIHLHHYQEADVGSVVRNSVQREGKLIFERSSTK